MRSMADIVAQEGGLGASDVHYARGNLTGIIALPSRLLECGANGTHTIVIRDSAFCVGSA
jgi:hypothetical protein